MCKIHRSARDTDNPHQYFPMKQPPRSVINGTALLLVAIGLYLVTMIVIKGCERNKTNDIPADHTRYTQAGDSLKILDVEKTDSLKKNNITSSGKRRSTGNNQKKQSKNQKPEKVYSPLDNHHN